MLYPLKFKNICSPRKSSDYPLKPVLRIGSAWIRNFCLDPDLELLLFRIRIQKNERTDK